MLRLVITPIVIGIGITLTASAAEVEAPSTLSVGRLRSSPAFQAHQNEILSIAHSKIAQDVALSSYEKAAIDQEIDSFAAPDQSRRTVDVELSFLSGFPDTAGICLEGFPIKDERLAIDACASTVAILSSFTANVMYRWKFRERTSQDGRSSQWAVGPGAGYRKVYDNLSGDARRPVGAINTFASLEYVRWVNQRFGWGLQFDFGVMTALNRPNQSPSLAPVLPNLKVTLGFNFRKPKRN